MTKEDFFDRLDEALERFSERGYSPEGLRVNGDRDPFNPKWGIWIVGPGSLDEMIVLATDIWPVAKYNSLEKANKELEKFRRWFKEWKE